MTSIQQIIEGGLVRSTANDAGKLADEGELIPFVNRRYQALYALWAAMNRDAAAAKVDVVLAAGVGPLPTDVIDLIRVETADAAKVRLIPIEEKDRLSWHLAPAVFRVGSTLHTRGATGDPAAADTLQVYAIDAPTELSDLAHVLDARFPARFHELLVLDVAIYLSVKDESRDRAEYQALRDERQIMMEQFLGPLSRAQRAAAQSPGKGAAERG